MSQNPFQLKDLVTSPGMSLCVAPDGLYELTLGAPLGAGSMRGRALCPHAFGALVDFTCRSCPSMATERTRDARWFSEGMWITVNLCLEGRCEVDIPRNGFAVVAAGDLCVSYSTDFPAEFRYPTGRYRGIEAFVNVKLADDPAFILLQERTPSLEDIARTAGFAAVIAEDDELNGHLQRMGAALQPYDPTRTRYELLGLLLALQRRDLARARPRVILTRAQMDMAHAAHDEIEGALSLPHDARQLAAGFGVSAATLNGYFSRVYGQTIAAYLRRRRMEEAAELLSCGASVAETALQVGYANPSKFAAAFKAVHGTTPREWRQRQRLHLM